MSERPQWSKNIMRFFDNDILDDDYPDDGSADPAVEDIEQFALDRLCKEFGHDIAFDQCGLPEHRYCYWCFRRETTIKEREASDD
jgi:hypothetical protein